MSSESEEEKSFEQPPQSISQKHFSMDLENIKASIPTSIAEVVIESEPFTELTDTSSPNSYESESDNDLKRTENWMEPHSHYVNEESMSSEIRGTTNRDPLDPTVKDNDALVLTCQPFDAATAFKRPLTPPADDEVKRKRHITSYELRTQWNFERIFTALGTQEQCLEFALNVGLVASSKMCHRHKCLMRVCNRRVPVGHFRCYKKKCRRTISRAIGTWFENCRMSLALVFRLMYCFAADYRINQTLRECTSSNRDTAVSNKTVFEWFCRCRKVIFTHFTDTHLSVKIGGKGKVVQIGERCFQKNKKNRRSLTSRRPQQESARWVIGMIEDGSDDLRLAAYPDNKRDAETLIPLIQKYVLTGTTIVSNSSPLYNCLPEYGYIHNPYSGNVNLHVQRIRSHWLGLKKRYDQTVINDFENWLVEYCWRKHVTQMHLDPFDELINAVKHVYKP